MKGTNSLSNKASNLRLVLNLIATNRPVSRIQVAKQSYLTKQTISNLTEALLDAGIVYEAGYERGGVGKPTRLLDLKPGSVFGLGVRVRAEKVNVGIFDIAGNCILERVFRPQYLDQVNIPNALAQICQKLIEDSGVDKSRILGIGLILPPPTHFRTPGFEEEQLDLDSVNLDYAVIRQSLCELSGLPVVIDSIAAAAATSEMLYGAAKELQSFVYVYLGKSIEAGYVVNRNLFAGYSGLAGRLGHVIVSRDGRPCSCGNNGCLDQYASLSALRNSMKAKLKSEDQWDSLLHDRDLYSEERTEWFNEMSEPMRVGLNALENLVNAQTVILGGDVPDWFLDEFIRKLRPFMPSVAQMGSRELPRLIRAPQVGEAVMRGAATLPIYAAITSQGGSVGGDMLSPADKLQQLILGVSARTPRTLKA